MRAVTVAQHELSTEDCDLLCNVSNEVLNGFLIEDFEILIGTTRKKYKDLSEQLSEQSVSRIKFGAEQTLLFRNALAATLDEFDPGEFQTRTGCDYKYGQNLLNRLEQQGSALKDKIDHDEHRAYFTIVGDFLLSEISERLSLTPTRSYSKGEARHRTGLPHEASRWSLDSRLDATISGNEHVKDVLNQLRPVQKVVRDLRAQYDGWIQVVGYFTSNGGFDIEATDVQEMSEMNLGLDFDVYMLSEGN